jgi:hypothetical protein
MSSHHTTILKKTDGAPKFRRKAVRFGMLVSPDTESATSIATQSNQKLLYIQYSDPWSISVTN